MGKQILIVDDDEMILNAISIKLKQQGFIPFAIKDSYEALDLILNRQHFDLAIIDLMLPGLSGLKLFRILNVYYPKIFPVIFISSLNQSDIVLNILERGARDFLFKPLNLDELMASISRVFPVTLKTS
jgi:two-component system response regulator MtrA